jgi:hypothetical protein
MAQDLTVNIKTTSDVPQAMDRAKTATVSFGKQVDDIQKKFSMAFKDIFLSFLGPLALLGIAMNYIGKLIEENRKKQEEANRAAIDGTNELMSAEDRYYARKRQKDEKVKEDSENAKTQRETTTREFLQNDPRAKEVVSSAEEIQRSKSMIGMKALADIASNPRIQEKVFKIIGEELKNNPEAITAPKESNFKGPEGFSNVVGVGANPVIEAMNEQLEEQRKQTALLEKIASPDGGVSKDFTKDSK